MHKAIIFEMPIDEAPLKEEIVALLNDLPADRVLPITIEAHNSWAVGFIDDEEADVKLDFDTRGFVAAMQNFMIDETLVDTEDPWHINKGFAILNCAGIKTKLVRSVAVVTPEQQRFVAVYKDSTTRDVQVYKGIAGCEDEDEYEDAWEDVPCGELYIGIFAGTEEEVRAKVAKLEECDPDSIRLIPVEV